MTLNDFINSSMKIAKENNEPFWTSALVRAANQIYRKNCIAPCFTIVRFDECFTTRSMRTRLSDKHLFNLLVKIVPGHPYFRPWLKSWVIRETKSLCLIDRDRNKPFDLCVEDEAANSPLDDIVNQVEATIIERINKFEESIRLLDIISERYNLQVSDISNYLHALQYAVKVTTVDENDFLDAGKRSALLPK